MRQGLGRGPAVGTCRHSGGQGSHDQWLRREPRQSGGDGHLRREAPEGAVAKLLAGTGGHGRRAEHMRALWEGEDDRKRGRV